MNVFLGGADPSLKVRNHPYSGAAYDDPRVRPYAFVDDPSLIREGVLEDFVPYQHYDSVELFYQLLEWLNGPESVFETSDCRLETPKKNPNKGILRTQVLCGRVMIFFRALERNLVILQPESRYDANYEMRALALGLDAYFRNQNTEAYWIGLDIFLCPIKYLQIRGSHQIGQQVMIQFNCFANGEEELFEAFKIPVAAIFGAVKKLNLEFTDSKSLAS